MSTFQTFWGLSKGNGQVCIWLAKKYKYDDDFKVSKVTDE